MTWLDHVDLLRCPDCGGELRPKDAGLRCEDCERIFEIRDGIPILLPSRWSETARLSVAWFQEQPSFFQRRLEKVRRGAEEAPFGLLEYAPRSGAALDCGSGAGLVPVLNARRGLLSVGVEISYHGARAGAELARDAGVDRCLFVVADAARLPFRSEGFDLVTGYGVIEHVHNPEAFVAQMARVSRPAGRCLVYEINRFVDPFVLALRRRLSRETLALFARGAAPLLRPSRRGALDARLVLDLSAEHVDAQVRRRDQVAAYLPLSYLVRDRFRRYFRLLEYRTHLLFLTPRRHLVTGALDVATRPVKTRTRLAGALYHRLDRVPLLRHTGEAIFLVGEKA